MADRIMAASATMEGRFRREPAEGSDLDDEMGEVLLGEVEGPGRGPALARGAAGALGAAALLIAAAGWAHGAQRQDVSTGAAIVGLEEEHCHTAVKGETCWIDVNWAMTDGIVHHADWYKPVCPFLKASSDFEEFQACIYKINQTKCALPCNPTGGAPKAFVDLPESHKETLEAVNEEHPCHIAKPGDDCYQSVLAAMKTGLVDTPDKFPGLTSSSTFEEFQAALFQDPTSTSCPRPCECHTAGPNDKCYDHVMWAQNTGIKDHPSWYPNLNAESSFEEIQGFLHKTSKGQCTLPCAPRDATLKAVKEAPVAAEHLRGKTSPSVDDAVRDVSKALHRVAESGGLQDGSESLDEEPACEAAEEGSSCYEDVLFAMDQGIRQHPDWYPGLTKFSSFEEFQQVIHDKKNPEHPCPRPCVCHTAKRDEECYEKVRWVVREGIDNHPSWYEGLASTSRFEEVQSRLQEDEKTACGTPCVVPKWGSPSLFCFSVFRSEGYEVDLVKAQVEGRVGIFKCDEFAALSDRELPITKEVTTLMIPPCETVGRSKDGTAANTEIFMKAWGVIWQEARWRAHDWVIKADPDAVVLVDRLRDHLRPHTGKNVYMKNCQKYYGPGWPMMFGSLEAISRLALENYFRGSDSCRDKLQWQAWGEDLFMGRCLDMLGSGSEFDGRLIGDNVCKGANCGDGVSAVYHPFKSADSWFQCYNQATR